MKDRVSQEVRSRLLAPRYWPTWLALGFARICAWLPLPMLVGIGNVIGTALYWFAAERRRVAGTNLRIAFPDYSAAEINRLNRTAFRNTMVGMLEIGLAWWSPGRVRAMTDVRGLEHLHAARAQGTGAMLLTAHFTSIEVGLPVLAAHASIEAMYKRPHNALMDRFVERHRARFTAVLASNDLPIRLIRGLKQGHALWYAPDQDFRGKDTVFVPLFGVDANSLTAPGRIAAMARVPVMPSLIRRKDWGRGYELTILPPLKGFPTGDDLEDARTINRVTEQLIKCNPTQYLWVHKRYKRRPHGNEDIYRP